MSQTKVLNIQGEEEFDKEVIKSNVPVLVDFWAPWCMPCKMMAPILDQLSDKMGDRLKVAKVDTEVVENRDLAMQYQIQSIPNMKLFKNGKMIADFIGLQDLETLKNAIEEKIK